MEQFYLICSQENQQQQYIQMLTEMLNNNLAFKTFILQDQGTQFSQVVLFPVDYSSPFLNLEQLFHSKIPNYRSCKLRIYDFSINQYVGIQEIATSDYKIHTSFVLNCSSVVLIKYKKNDSESGSSFKQTFSESEGKIDISQSSSLKKQRAKQRIISQVIEIVKRWRDLHVQKRGQKKISLQQAAKIVGLPKKSLDDYYYQLRLGQKYGFDFKKHFYQRIGCLRNFLKQKKPRLKSQHSDKHPKNLKVIEQYDQMRINSNGMKIQEEIFEEYDNRNNNQEEKMMFQQDDGQCVQMKLQNQFYEDFGFLQSQQDPFINLDGNFKKKKHEKLFDQQLFF